ncbi:E3 ubiquitin-protein ligase TRIM39-like [Pundamilia nyererei]|uniref:E3 ubiquitin-protein ligase TRIM39-like n=1 Tax=Pundamilia nyererei TaxID=303518 RepID=A0A9Y3S3W3_9CICH|nr:PREDICTED: E3 ubiquitin-protein ligase TRIM39-like [Pundamilia nyererei]
MSAASCLLSEDRFLCSICQDVFTDPVSTPCGHNFCKNCISQHWDISERFECPMCKKVFYTKTELHINSFISEMVSQFRLETQQKSTSSSSSEQQAAKPGEVPCDICTGTKLKALKSCLVCLASYCQTHLEPHLTMKGLKRHQLIDPEENLEGRMCMKHDQPLELFCKTDQTCVCMLCSVIDHKTHEFVPLREEYEGKKAELGKDMKKLFEAELKRVQQYAVDVTLDPDTAHPKLILSRNGKQVHCGDRRKKRPDNPERFLVFLCVSGKQSFSSGRFYFEVQVKEKTRWILGVVRESVNRKKKITPSPEKGYWTVGVYENICVAFEDPEVRLPLQSGFEKVGVFVDYEEGLVSFYDADHAALIYSFTGCSFTGKLYPFFCPGVNDDDNSAPLIICPVNQSVRSFYMRKCE